MKTLSFLFLYVLLAVYTKAQSKEVCGSQLNLSSLKKTDSAFYERIMKFEQHTQNFIKASKTASTPTNARLISSDKTIIIPVVVHILYNGTGENIPDSRVVTQIATLNEDFRRLNADAVNTPAAFQSVAADMNFEFRMAAIDPGGNATTGITRTSTTIDQFDALRPKITSQGGKDAWPTNTYLNIWVCDLASSLLGTGTFPSESYCTNPALDGVVVDYAVFGLTGSRTATHEVGHWLNLLHVFGAEEDLAACATDFVDDTPPALVKNESCRIYPYTTLCSPSSPGEMFMNYMDYTPDNCKNLFTQGQKLRARAAFAESTVPGICTRFNAIQNYFSIQPIPVGCGSTFVYLQNPMNLGVTWTITGNATITATTTTNKYLLTGTGTVTITAKGADSYVDDRLFTFSDPPVNLVLTPSPVNCDHTIFTVSGMTGSTFNWSVNGNLLIDGTLTSKSTSSNQIEVVGMDGIVYVNSTAGCNTNFQTTYTYSPYSKEIVLDPNSPLMWIDHINALVEEVQFADYYRWYVNDILVGQGEGKVNYCTCHFESWDMRQCGINHIRLEVDLLGCGTVTVGELEFEVQCGFARTRNSSVKPSDPRERATNVNDQKSDKLILIYPNPVRDQITITLPDNNKIKQVQIISITGTVIMQKTSSANLLKFDLSGLASGTYIVRVRTDKEVISRKIECLR